MRLEGGGGSFELWRRVTVADSVPNCCCALSSFSLRQTTTDGDEQPTAHETAAVTAINDNSTRQTEGNNKQTSCQCAALTSEPQIAQ